MESKISEAHTDKKAGAEEQKQHPASQWKEIFRSAKRDLSPGYLPNMKRARN